MRCTFQIIEKDGQHWAWCETCDHGYPTEMRDPAQHVRECRLGRGKPATKPKVVPCVHRGKFLRVVKVDSCCGSKASLYVDACQIHGECTKGRDIESVQSCKRCPDISAP